MADHEVDDSEFLNYVKTLVEEWETTEDEDEIDSDSVECPNCEGIGFIHVFEAQSCADCPQCERCLGSGFVQADGPVRQEVE